MSNAGILVGLGVGLVGWVALGRARATVDAAQKLDPVDATVSADVGEPQNNVTGVVGIATAVEQGAAGASTLGGDPVQGAQDGQTMSVTFTGPSGEPGVVVDPNASTGGADPSCQRSAVSDQKRDDGAGFWAGGQLHQGNTAEIAYEALWGPAGSSGVTASQKNIAYATVGKLGGEVW